MDVGTFIHTNNEICSYKTALPNHIFTLNKGGMWRGQGLQLALRVVIMHITNKFDTASTYSL